MIRQAQGLRGNHFWTDRVGIRHYLWIYFLASQGEAYLDGSELRI